MTQTGPQSKFDFRFVAALVLLAPAVLFTWRTMDGLAKRRLLRMDQAEIGHVRYSLLNADRWVEQILPILNGKIDALDLTAQSGASLRLTVERALYRLLDQVKEPSPRPASGGHSGGFAAQANAVIANMIVSSLRPRVPQFVDVVLTELGSPKSKQAVKKFLAGVLAEGAKSTFSVVDMSSYSDILKQYVCDDAAACRQELGNRVREADDRIARWYTTALGATALAFVLLLA